MTLQSKYLGRRQPLLLASALAAANRVRRLQAWVGSRSAFFCLLVAVMATLVGGLWLIASSLDRSLIEWVVENDFIIGLLVTMHMTLFVVRQRSHAKTAQTNSWLVATSAFHESRRVALLIAVLLPVFAQSIIAMIAVLVVAQASGIEFSRVVALFIWIATGTVAGVAFGAWLPQRANDNRHSESRYVRQRRSTTFEPSLNGLSRWPIAKALAWHRPENSKMLFIVAALSVPAGTSAILGLAILAAWSLASYLLALLRSMPQVANEAALWLRPTSLRFPAFAWAIARRALVHQLIGTALLGATFALLSDDRATAIYLASLWLVLVTMVTSISLSQHFIGRGFLSRTLVCVALVLLAEYRSRGWGLPIAATASWWHLRGALRDART